MNRRQQAAAAMRERVAPTELDVEDAPDDSAAPTLRQVAGAIGDYAAQSRTGLAASWSQDDLDMLAFVLFAAVFIVVAKALKEAKVERRLRPTSQEINRFCSPLARIVARRVRIPHAKAGDVKDVLAMFAASAAYGLRLWEYLDARDDTRPVVDPRFNNPRSDAPPPSPGQVRAAVPPDVRREIEEGRDAA